MRHVQPSDPIFKAFCSVVVRPTVYRRGDDPELFRIFTSFVQRPLHDCLAEARAAYPHRFQAVDWHLVTSHAHRKKLNRKCNAELAHAYWVRTGKYAVGAEGADKLSFQLWPGLWVIATATSKGLVNGKIYKVEGIGETLNLGEVSGPLALAQHLRPAHALTTYTCQSLTLPGRIRVYTSSRHFCTVALMTAMSRATHGSLLEVL